jgi:TolB protein
MHFMSKSRYPRKGTVNRKGRTKRGILITPARFIILVLINIIVFILLGWPFIQSGIGINTMSDILMELPPTSTDSLPTQIQAPSATATPTLTPTPIAAAQIAPTEIVIPSTPESPSTQYSLSLMVLSISDEGYTHLFAYHPEILPFTRLTNGPWDDIHPALSPDGTLVAFSSHRAGYWDIYTLDLTNGKTTQLTDDPGYDGAPTWSPDGLWLAFEKYMDGNLEIYIHLIGGATEPFPLTNHPAADFAPSWSPGGRKIAFTSDRSGGNDIWIADLDKAGDQQFSNLTQNPTSSQSLPAWSPDGKELAWVSAYNGYDSIFLQQVDADRPILFGTGSFPVWDPSGEILLTSLSSNNQTYLTAYTVEDHKLFLPPKAIPNRLEGFTWGVSNLTSIQPEVVNEMLDSIEPEMEPDQLFDQIPLETGPLFGRQDTIEIADVEAPHPELAAMAVEPFYELRDRLATETGWDVLASLENAFVPLTVPLAPGMGNDWLYTGRAFSLNPAWINAGMMIVMKEEVGTQTYWRVYIRPLYQDGSQGKPLVGRPWDFNARFGSNPDNFEKGGAMAPTIPNGYWVDFTAIASEYGWQRVPALTNWRTFYPVARFNEFVLFSGLDWEFAMLQLYPPDILITPTPIHP